MNARAVTVSEEYLASLEHGADWREEIEEFCARKDIDSAWFNAMGAVQDAELWFYDQNTQEYQSVTFDEPLEVASCVGNVALLDGEPFAHTHAVLSRRSGQSLAGHLNAGTVFAGELYLRAFEEPLEREHDDVTDLDLWL
ncbi:polA operon protein (DNA-binding protein) [Haloferax elongans ATCC BAA-1513]|uniref:PolA operon protein (DNA-binding protein) n=1 Tax=Haloferax elongans ATCC BAA-1513 TaxID=1230453 RepID=M0HVN4_HALEO|nr:PPC domain-containing DNA-binding protein [Haloferax elongans]ELZ87194.1 polA operon protein (DNA-binding protein) [Haloferax elongans ATCC BAA-1513]